eukprot:comp19102_c1_seq1/m.21676 comp19102_c1_seq1/g.21676  ORF comp19102_c1_seq1/g.21676 comp19102_c1_seq1/m.21676 type:complete len:141 (-) comp19102_c1_seq1:226-648(-)
MIDISDTQKIGAGLAAFGSLFVFMGVLMFFDRGLLAMGNVLFVSGVSLLIGIQKTFQFFFNSGKWKGSLCFFFGILIVFWGRPIVGMIVESFGFINLFGDFFPTAINFMRRLPIIGHVLNLPVIAQIIDRTLGSGARLPV